MAVDGASWGILLADLATACAAAMAGTTPTLPRPVTSFRTWAAHLAELAAGDEQLNGLRRWTETLKGGEPGPEAGLLGTGSARSRMTLQLAEDETAALLTTVPTAFHATVEDALLAGLTLEAHLRRKNEVGARRLQPLRQHLPPGPMP
mgnify:CR=1 FL=1